ncbi:MAG: hypothetical protein H6739_07495 [Alphaproteobacteria bacterium]|nr:hypothetical protein [Alphaproteobacteria bacterium]
MNAKFQVETFILRAAPPLRAGARSVAPVAFALRRWHDVLEEPRWQAIVDLSRVDALELEGHVEGLTAVGLARLPRDKAARLVLTPDEALAAALERASWAGGLVLSNGLLGSSILVPATDACRYRLDRLDEAAPWSG